ncbi:MAG: hypothetical protein EXS59_01720 [Candidatus Taylorbacteria bacterium]|nr:hypothetical protein [Candidatus Taylorbacteria bacterium]
MERIKDLETLLVVYEQEPNLPLLDLHTFESTDVGAQLQDFLVQKINEGIDAVRVVYGRGGRRALRNEALLWLKSNIETGGTNRLVSGFGEENKTAGGSCVVILDK